jgi:hypothetical protein
MKVIREISRGGFGRVEEVELANGEHYARKIFNPAFPTSSEVVLAAVQLGKKHHRFFVMRRVIQMCGTILDDIVARRIVIEINAQEQQSAFINFVKVLDRDFNEYHPRIAELLTQFVTLSP